MGGPGDGVDTGLDRDYRKQFEDDIEKDDNLYFAKCREGIRLFRGESVRSREPEISPISPRFVLCNAVTVNT